MPLLDKLFSYYFLISRLFLHSTRSSKAKEAHFPTPYYIAQILGRGIIRKVKSSNLGSFSYSTKKLYTTRATLLNPFFITGFVDGVQQSSFNVNIYRKGLIKRDWTVSTFFAIILPIEDLAILKQIKYTWGIGKIFKHSKNAVQFKVFSVKELRVVIEHFDKYPLVTSKLVELIILKKLSF